VARDDPFLRDWATWSQDERVALLTVGTYQPEDAGSHCYHVKLEVAQMVLHRTLDSARERIVCDSTAGSDPVGTSMFFASDCNIVVVEPTSRSIAVYEGIRRIGQRCGLRTFVIANKVADADDATFVRQAVPDEDLVGEVRVSASLRRLDRGVDGALDEFVAENADLWAAIRRLHAGEEWDWDAYLGRLRRAFADNCAWWYDAYYSRSLAEDIDQTFRYSNVIRPAMSAS
jgi:CO dehydrogenase nickel-insertion accessory protein CooC1